MSSTNSTPDPRPSVADDAEASRRAVQALVAAALGFSLMSLFARLAGAALPSVEIVFFRSLVSLVLTVVMLRRVAHEVASWRGTRRGLLLLRGVLGFGALSCFFYSVTHLPLAEATVVQFTSPIFTALLAAAVLGERTTPRIWIAIVLGLVGVTLIARPGPLGGDGPSALPLDVLAIGLLGAVLTAGAQVTVRRLTVTEHELVIVLHFQMVAVPAALATALPVWRWPTPHEWLLLLAVGTAGQVGQVALTRGLKRVTAASAAIIMYLQIVFASVWGIVVLGEQLDAWTLAGSLVVLAGTVASARRPRVPG